MNPKLFLTFLNQYKDRDDLTKADFYRMLQCIDDDYALNINKNFFLGHDYYFQHERLNPIYFTNVDFPIWEVDINKWKDTSANEINQHPYDNWVASHEIELDELPHLVSNVVNNVTINISEFSKTLSGLIEIVKTYECEENTIYNIDLKALHNVKEELIELNDMIGMKDLKEQILDQLLYFIQKLHINKDSDYKHTIIYGSPGVGKSCVCKLIGTMYSKLGILKNNIFKKVTRSDLVAGYLGQTSIKTNKVIQECLGGVLFIDEVYSLGNKNSDGGIDTYSKECIDTLCEALSFYRDDLMVIVAGYKEEIEECFFSVNKGLASRFIWRFSIDGYNSVELLNIFLKKISENDWQVSEDLTDMEKWFDNKKDNFKNYGRDMELLFSYTKICHSKRIFGTSIHKIINKDDIEDGFKAFVKNSTEVKRIPYGIYI
jgi:SpoVK/Ycf46/Vps4 family AAA+-type ATPase